MFVDVKKINDFALAMLEQASLDDLLWSAAQGVGEIMGFEDCVIYLRVDENLVQMAAFGIKNQKDRQIFERLEIPVGKGIVGTVAKTKHAEIVTDTHIDKRYIFDQFSGRSELAVPVIYEGETIAVIDSESAFKNNYTNSDKELLQVIANIVSPRIASALYERSLQTAQIRLKRANHQLHERMEDLKHNQQSLIQSEKMASVGTLAAGIAHEINNPLGYSISNLCMLQEYVKDIKTCNDKILSDPYVSDHTKSCLTDTDYTYVIEDLDDLTSVTLNGLKVAKNIVADLRGFAHSKDGEFCALDINEGIKTTLNVVNSQLKNHCKIKLNLNPLPEVHGNIGKLNQVFMNIILNASQACDDNGVIEIDTYDSNGSVCIEISDNGKGIPKEHLSDIFSPFFTTKPVGQGTGLGLSISYQIIKEEHQGLLTVESNADGTKFKISLPIYVEETLLATN
ncbi:GAF domain-containing protein [Pseudoalteromonas sp. C2R02]|uniref:ATP-binding protein n=1 Tax=Pseudoalteromonas sp. C2R02 TaxID=2841565 RepID=UPI001C08B9F8|nr:ATP-binding protein [Pseudoalteromonas sp. C2R02]MBU2968311.1 GAF domain-containing protein [Pseudoalteromonas sp. C2R02]